MGSNLIKKILYNHMAHGDDEREQEKKDWTRGENKEEWLSVDVQGDPVVSRPTWAHTSLAEFSVSLELCRYRYVIHRIEFR